MAKAAQQKNVIQVIDEDFEAPPQPQAAAEEVEKSFDYRTHIRDPKTAQVVKVQHYRARFRKGMGTVIERPIGSNKFFNEAGDPVDAPEAQVK